MKIYLIRHGEAGKNVGVEGEKRYNLTKNGKIQARNLGKRLKDFRIDKIYTSDLIRAKETGEIISKKLKKPLEVPFKELNEFDAIHLRSRVKFLTSRKRRPLKKFIKELQGRKDEDKSILIVAHGITNRIIISHFLKMPINKKLFSFRQENTCINEIYWSKNYKGWKIKKLNDTTHLDDSN